jgi:hypothetical protein
MNEGRSLFSQLLEHAPHHHFRRCVEVRTQIWIAISVYVLVAIVKKRLDLRPDLYTLLQILSVHIFQRTELRQALSGGDYKICRPPHS